MTNTVAARDGEEYPFLLDRQFSSPLYAATNLLNWLYAPILAKLDLTYSQYLVLLVLWEEEPQTMGALGARLHRTTGTLTPLLKRMEAGGYVTRHRDPGDERRVIVELTAKGQVLCEKAVHVPCTIASGRSQDGIDDLREGVRKLVAMLAEQDA